MSDSSAEAKSSKNFLEEIIDKDLAEGRHTSILTRFPPEPNGYLHIGHAKSINVNFGLAKKYGGETNLRFDDTNPITESTEYVQSIKRDVEWLGYEWKQELYASDYFEKLYEFALKLIRDGLAYVDDSTSEQIAALKGTPTTPGTNSPYRDRSPEENEELFKRMRDGEFPDGSRTLRAKIDMAAPNMLMRDPVIYRIKNAHHHRTDDKWCIYPTYDFAHGQSDAIENITHSICTLEFMPHRPLYEWFIEKLGLFPSRQYEFARLNLSYTVMSKRKLLQLVNEGHVESWDDPRMPTISGLRRRGYTPAAIREFCNRIGVAKRDNLIDVSLLEFCAREDLNRIAERRMVVLDPVKLIITNFPEDKTEMLPSENNPEDEQSGEREVPFTRELLIEREDFMEDAPRKFFRLSPGRNVRLKSAFIITCDDFKKDEKGEVTEIYATYHPDSRSGSDTSGIKAKGTLHWVSASHAVPVEVRSYDRLFNVEDPAGEEGEITDYINPDSLVTIPQAWAEPAILDDLKEKSGSAKHFQFMRKGYYYEDISSTAEKPVFNQTVGLRDTWAKQKGK
ncbi:MAG: glutamine--tRNA ligase/YqeY domain fusion protein [Balneolia bacterium]|nr:glutamine--tRNA ligase/YqeY domain fusion protein [Balneolia bacterium]